MTTAELPVNPNSIAPLKNVAALQALVDELLERPDNNRRFGTFSGFSGYGKSLACSHVQNSRRTYCLEVASYWTKKKFAENLLKELGQIKPRGTFADMMDEAIERLADEPRPLLIDEADKLFDNRMIEVVRDIHDRTKLPIVLIGEENLPKKVAMIERVDGRVLGRVLAQPCDLADTRLLSRFKCPGVTLSDDLLERVHQETKGNAGQITISLHNLRRFAGHEGLKSLDLASYREGIFTGQVPVRARRVA